ncbi:MAG TPA: hypothetical protein VFA50_07810 [Stellaceae bacterium]|nr:hypothetical protein [Stellaceae bacterium]
MTALALCGALLASACAGAAGPTTTAEITSDIHSAQWLRNQLPAVVPGTAPPIATGDQSETVIP